MATRPIEIGVRPRVRRENPAPIATAEVWVEMIAPVPPLGRTSYSGKARPKVFLSSSKSRGEPLGCLHQNVLKDTSKLPAHTEKHRN